MKHAIGLHHLVASILYFYPAQFAFKRPRSVGKKCSCVCAVLVCLCGLFLANTIWVWVCEPRNVSCGLEGAVLMWLTCLC